MQAANRVILNTCVLYLRVIITAGITLYTTRLVLNALGQVDYGIYNLIAGVILMLSFLNTAMAVSTQRYLSVYQGKSDLWMQKKIFTNSLLLHIIIGILVVIFLEIIGIFLFDGFFNIPEERIRIAEYIYHFMTISVFFTIVSVPFSGSLFAHENIVWIAVVSIIEVLIKLVIAIFLYKISIDKLFFYGITMALVSLVSLLLYAFFCLKKYQECSLKIEDRFDKYLLRKLASFAGWNLFGALCAVGKTQGLAVILNLFFGAIVNASYAIANQVSAQMNFFSATLLRTLNPQIMKSEGAGDRKRMLRLSMMASKFGFFLFAFVAIPCIFEMQAILALWLGNVPDYAVVFCSLSLISILTNQLTIGLQPAAQATGRIREYQSVVGSILLSNLLIAYILLYLDFPAYVVLMSSVFIEGIACVFRLIFLKKIAGLSIREYFNRVFKKEIFPVIVSTLSCLLIIETFDFHFRFLLTITFSSLLFAITVYFLGFEKEEKDHLNNLIKKILQKIW